MGLFRSHRRTILPLVRFMETPINPPLDNTFYKVTHRSPPNFCLSRKKVVPLRDKTGLPLLGLRLPRPPQRGGLQRMGKRFVPNRCDGTPKTRTPTPTRTPPTRTPPTPSERGTAEKSQLSLAAHLSRVRTPKPPKTPHARTPNARTPPAPSKRGNSAKNTQTTKIRKANIRISKYTQSGNTQSNNTH